MRRRPGWCGARTGRLRAAGQYSGAAAMGVMGLLRGLRRSASSDAAKIATFEVRVVDHTRTHAAADGTRWWSAGETPVEDGPSGEWRLIEPGEDLCDGNVLYCLVAGVQEHASAIDDPRFQRGSVTLLIPEPWNKDDANAVGVWDLDGSIQAGHLPPEHGAGVTERLDRGEHLVGYVLSETRRGSELGPRAALHMLVGPAGAVAVSTIDR